MVATNLLRIGLIVLAGIVSEPIVSNANQNTLSDPNAVAFAYSTKEQYLVGEPILLRIEVHNLDSRPIYVRNNRGFSFKYSARHSSGKMAKDIRPAQISIWSGLVQVEPGKDFNDVFYLDEFLEFRDPGLYTISYSGRLPVLKTRESLPSTGPKRRPAVPLSGTFEITLRRGSAGELEKALRAYLKPLSSSTHRIRMQAARALIVSEPMLAVKLLREVVNENESAKAAKASANVVAYALGRIHTDEAIKALCEFATDPNSYGRMHAISELGSFHIKEGKPILIGLLSDEDPRVRVQALQALRNLADKSTIPLIEDRLTDPDRAVRKAAEKALKALTKKRDEE
jgi:hypothetical protein